MPNGDTAADFNGTNQNLRVTSNPSFSITTTGDLTWEAWIRPDVLQFPRSSSDGFVAFMGKCATYGSPPTCEWESRMYDMAYDTWFQGAIGKVAIYNYRLSQTQINNHYQTMTGAQPTGSCRGTCSFQ